MTGVCDVGIGNEKKLWIDSVRGAYRVKFFVPGCNTMGVQLGWSSSHAKPSTSPQLRE